VVSSHDLADIEALAHHVVVIDRGRLVTQGPLEDLLHEGMTRVVVHDIDAAASVLAEAGMEGRRDENGIVVDSDDGSEIVRLLAAAGIFPSEVRPERATLESVFLGITGELGG
jgi:ABC-2 type transport system ATP-binding protein